MATDKVRAEIDGPIGRVTFDNPEKHNAVSLEMWDAAARILSGFVDDAGVRVIVITGAGGKAFVSGADISKFEDERATAEAVARYSERTRRVFAEIHALPKPTIAMIDGYCIGGGLALAVSCDVRICSEKSPLRPAGGASRPRLSVRWTAPPGRRRRSGEHQGHRLHRPQVQCRRGARHGPRAVRAAGGRAGAVRQGLRPDHRRQRPAHRRRHEGDRRRGDEGPRGPRHGAVPAARRRMLRERGLRRGPPRLHGETRPHFLLDPPLPHPTPRRTAPSPGCAPPSGRDRAGVPARA